MRALLRIAVLTGCLAAFVVLGGGHWAVLQTVAWAEMVVDYTQDTGSLREGLSRTFDGAHPCEVCKAISVGIQKESQDNRQQPLKKDLLHKGKLAAVLPLASFVPLVQSGELLPALAFNLATRPDDAPPVPPPRTVGLLA